MNKCHFLKMWKMCYIVAVWILLREMHVPLSVHSIWNKASFRAQLKLTTCSIPAPPSYNKHCGTAIHLEISRHTIILPLGYRSNSDSTFEQATAGAQSHGRHIATVWLQQKTTTKKKSEKGFKIVTNRDIQRLR